MGIMRRTSWNLWSMDSEGAVEEFLPHLLATIADVIAVAARPMPAASATQATTGQASIEAAVMSVAEPAVWAAVEPPPLRPRGCEHSWRRPGRR